MSVGTPRLCCGFWIWTENALGGFRADSSPKNIHRRKLVNPDQACIHAAEFLVRARLRRLNVERFESGTGHAPNQAEEVVLAIGQQMDEEAVALASSPIGVVTR
jgi:hypothetical protein